MPVAASTGKARRPTSLGDDRLGWHMELFIGLFMALACAAFGEKIGKPKGRGLAGRVLGFLLGPIGLIIIYLLPPKASGEMSAGEHDAEGGASDSPAI